MTDLAIRVVIADDHADFRRTVEQILLDDPEVHIVAEAGDGPQALAAVQAWRPDVAILDLDMPGCDGLAVAQSIRDLNPPVRTILLTAHGSAALLDRARAAGVYGYLRKDDAVANLLDCLHAVHTGRRVI
jgi:two-component system response regulator DesR